jgi:hypothetical protein
MADTSHKHHASLGQGFIKIQSNDGPDDLPCFVMVHSWWTPTLPVTVFSPAVTVERHKDLRKGYSTTLGRVALSGTFTLHRCNSPAQDICLLGIKQRLLMYTSPLVPSDPQELHDVAPRIAHLSARTTQVIWHQRLNHCHARRVSDLHKHVDGIPKIENPHSLDGCDT